MNDSREGAKARSDQSYTTFAVLAPSRDSIVCGAEKQGRALLLRFDSYAAHSDVWY